jgi:site-specific DNA recombinase
VCGCACSGRTHRRGEKRYPYYRCTDSHPARSYRGPAHDAPYVNADWLEELVWADVRRFITNPGEVLERVRAERADDSKRAELTLRRDSLRKRLADAEKEREELLYLFRKGIATEDELSTQLADLRLTIENITVMSRAVDSDLATHQQEELAAKSAEAYLMTLHARLEEIEADSAEAFEKRRKLVKLLVEKIEVGRGKDGHIEVEITYRFPAPSEGVVSGDEETRRSSALNG